MRSIPKNSSKEKPASIASDEVVIAIDKLKKAFGYQQVLKNVSFTLHKGENLVVLGKSGSGKSVLIKCIVGLLTADSGSIKVFNQKVESLNTKDHDF